MAKTREQRMAELLTEVQSLTDDAPDVAEALALLRIERMIAEVTGGDGDENDVSGRRLVALARARGRAKG